MNFYVSLVFLGILLVAVSLVLVVLDRKKVFGFTQNFDQKKQELIEIINDAEQMIEELNRFSDYIVTQMDIKNEELRMNIKTAEEGINSLGQKVQTISASVAETAVEDEQRVSYKPMAAANGGMIDVMPVFADVYNKSASLPIDNKMNENHISMPVYQPPKQTMKKAEKIIPMKTRYSEVLHLAETGLSVLEIAKTLNMGKGEVELILGLNKN